MSASIRLSDLLDHLEVDQGKKDELLTRIWHHVGKVPPEKIFIRLGEKIARTAKEKPVNLLLRSAKPHPIELDGEVLLRIAESLGIRDAVDRALRSLIG